MSEKISNLDDLCKAYQGILEDEFKYCSEIHEPKLLRIEKLAGRHNTNYSLGHTETGMCGGIEVGKQVLLSSMNRWFKTSIVKAIDEPNSIFTTNNSTYRYTWLPFSNNLE